MLKIQYYLKQPNSKQETPIVLCGRLAGKLFRFYPGIMLHPKYWEKRAGRIKNSGNFCNAVALNRKLEMYRSHIQKVYLDLEYNLNRPPNQLEFKIGVEEKLGIRAPKSPQNFETYAQCQMNLIESQLLSVGRDISTNTLAKSYGQTLATLKHCFPNKSIQFDDINMQMYTRFLEFCRVTKGFKPNTTGKHIRNIKALMNRAFKDNLHTNMDFNKFKKIEEDVDSIYLSEEELQSLLDIQFPENLKHLEQTRDIFIIGCWTGLRFSDWQQLISSNLANDFIEIITQKTEKPIQIPIHPTVRHMFHKYGSQIPKLKHNVVVNRELKEIGELAGITESITITETKGSRRISKTLPKWALITTHTARRSFATNLYNSGKISAVDIMQITGHRKETTFLRYIKTTPKEAAIRIFKLYNTN